MPGIEDLTPGLEDVSQARFQNNFKLPLTAGVQNIYNYLLLDRNIQWSAQLTISSPERTCITFHNRKKVIVIEHTAWRSPEKYLDWEKFHKAFQLHYPNVIENATRLLFCYAVVHKLVIPSAVEVEGLRRCFIIDIRRLREAIGL